MTTESTTKETTPPESGETSLEKVGDLGISTMGEAFVVKRVADEHDFLTEDSDEEVVSDERFVIKKITRARLRDPERFRQKFEALRRLEHPHLCHYRDLYIGEQTARITRDFVDGLTLTEFLAQPITEEEQAHLADRAEITEPDEDPSDITEETGADEAQETPLDQNAPDDAAPLDDDVDDHPDINEASSTTSATDENEPDEALSVSSPESSERPTTLEIPLSLLEDSEVADQVLDLIILRLRHVLPQIIDALEYLHRFRHVHGGLNPSNILITEDRNVVLTDFGLHPELVTPPSSKRRYASYQAPETDGQNFSPCSDLYSLGSILFEALAERPYGERRIQEDTDHAAQAEQSCIYLSEIVPHCPATWSDLIHGLLADDPKERLALDEVHAQLASSEQRSVNIPASVVEEQNTLHGRRDTLNQLTEFAKDCSQHRQLGLAMLKGETGVGKTAIVDALARWAAQLGWVVLHGRCYHHQPVVYQGWEDIVDRLVTITDELPEKPRRRLEKPRRRASRLFPQLATENQARPNISRHAAVGGFRSFLEHLSIQRPILICLDDVHCAGLDSIRLLADLAEQPERMRVMVVTTSRPMQEDLQEENPLWSELATAPIEIEQITVDGFSKYEAREYVLANAAHLGLRQKQKILRRGGFNPLLIDELIHELNDDPRELDTSGDPDSEAATTDSPTDAPSSELSRSKTSSSSEDTEEVDDHLSTFVEHRLTDLTRAERLVLQLLAIASGPLTADLLARAMSRELGAQTADLVTGQEVAESLVKKRLARQTRRTKHSADQSTRYVVIHDLCRRVIRSEVGRDHHARLCGLIADALETNERDTDDLRFEYLNRAGRTEAASRTARRSAAKASDRFAHHRAIRMWQWIQEHQDLSEADTEQFSLALLGASHFQQALEQLDRLIPHSNPEQEILFRRLRIGALLATGQRDAAVVATDEAMRATIGSYRYFSPLSWRPIDLRERLLASMSRWSDATSIAHQNEPSPEIQQRADLLDFALQLGPFLRTAATPNLQHRFARLAYQDRFGPLLGRDRLQMIGTPWLPLLIRDGKKIDRWVQQAITLFEESKDLQGKARATEIMALIARHRGELARTVELIDEAWTLLDASGIDDEISRARLTLLRIDIALLQADLTEASAMSGRFLHRTRHNHWLSILASLSACDRDLLEGNLDRVHHRLDELDEFIGEEQNCLLHFWAMERRTRLNIARGRSEVAVAQWDLLLDRVYTRSLRKLPAARLIINRSLCIALSSLAHRQLALHEPRRRETLRRFRSHLRRLADLEPWMGKIDRATLYRLQARFELIRRRPSRALHRVDQAASLFDNAPALVQAMTQEARGFVLLQLEDPNARSTLDNARTVYDELGLYIPLFLEGWPVPNSHSALKQDS